MTPNFTEKLTAAALLSIFFIYPYAAKPIPFEPDWSKCSKINNSEIVDYILGKKFNSKNSDLCLANDILHIKMKNGNKARIGLKGDRWFDTEPIGGADMESAMSIFREMELNLAGKIGIPFFSHKQGENTNQKTALLLMKRGKIEYRTEWKLGDKYLVLLLSGENLALYIKMYYKRDSI